jgi:hypothetical protein
MRMAMVATLMLVLGGLASAQEPASATVNSADSGLSELVTAIVRANLPHEYEKKKNWGQTKEIWDGVHVKLDGVRVKTKRKKKAVNHGTWTMYRATLTDPQQFAVSVTNLRRLDDGRAAFDADFVAPLAVFGRISEWQLGVQLISLSANADARVRLQITCAVKTKMVASKTIVPDVLIEPEVTAAKIIIEEFQLKRISQLHGPLVKELGKGAHDFLQEEVDDRNAQIVAKINKQIVKQQDKLRLSLSDLANTKFGDLRSWVTGHETLPK